MINTIVNPNEQFGEKVGKAIKTKINKGTYFLLATVLIGGLSAIYSFSKGLIKGWTRTRIANQSR